MKPKPFRILLVDDEARQTTATGGTINPLTQLRALLQKLNQEFKESGATMELLVSTSVGLESGKVAQEMPTQSQANTDAISDYRQAADFPKQLLCEIDLLILDLGNVGELLEMPNREAMKKRLQQISADLLPANDVFDDDFDRATKDGAENVSGVGFYHCYYDDLREAQAVFILTRHDEKQSADDKAIRENKGTPWTVRRWIDPFCNPRVGHPYTAKYAKGSPGNSPEYDRMLDRIETLFRLWARGYTQLELLPQIEEAAMTNEPVMLVGETGTGKCYLARAIHLRWAQEEIRAKRLDEGVRDRFVAINCSLLSGNTAENELFGHLSGAFTNANYPALGRILGSGCGGRLGKSQDREPVKEFTDKCKEFLLPHLDQNQQQTNNFVLLRPKPGAVTETERQPELDPQALGTLFLDEFGDLPLEIQAQLLRYLEGWEVQPMGLPGVVKGARLRIIAATSDPRFAAFAGCLGTKTADTAPPANATDAGQTTTSTDESPVTGSRTEDDEDFSRVPLIGQWRGPKQLEEPLRADLLFRIKGHILRAPPVTAKNARNVVSAMLTAQQKEEWDDDAKRVLVNEVQNQAAAVEQRWEHDPTGQKNPEPLPLFGHRREIHRVIRLAEAWVKSAPKRGLRLRKPGVVTAEVIAIVFRPSALFQLAAPTAPAVLHAATDTTSAPAKPVREPWSRIDQFRVAGVGKDGEILDHLLQLFLKNRDITLEETAIQSHLNDFEKRTSTGARKLTYSREDTQKKVSALRAKLKQKAPFEKSGVHLVGNCLSTTPPSA